ncbi:ABC transporter permease [Alicyclobacillus mengziensis]|uniref:ABC transporter permease n=1 Tax=Alicyclobacillus mengziensis TaxID=2931921 RepID=A0A9X7Z908_9BACL|nr:ABC transporter permease [Alicyclobacillus mengziensis]QSO48856.1 ABC transporter permease [Alicyclobacillus mengziensis]
MLTYELDDATGDLPRSRGPLRQKFLTNPTFWLGVVIFLGLLFFCFAGPMLDGANPLTIHLGDAAQPPSAKWPFGTDALGRNELTRLMYGGRLMLLIGFVSAVSATVLGLGAGLVSGFYGGSVDRVLSWTMDVISSVPQLVPLLLFEVLVGTSPTTMIVVVAATSWPFVGRPIRAEVMSFRTREFVMAAKSLGANGRRIILRHLLPNLWPSLLTSVSTCFGTAVLIIATASFLGFNLPPPYPDWGSMIAQGMSGLYDGYWWLIAFPGACLVLLQVALNFMADAVRDSFDSKWGVGL